MTPDVSQPLGGESHETSKPENRLAKRELVDKFAYLASKTHIRTPCKKRLSKCRIVDTSSSGYRVVLLSHLPDAAERYELGQETSLEHEDGWQRAVIVRWCKLNMLGLELVNREVRLLLKSASGQQQAHLCEFLGQHGELYRLNFSNPDLLVGSFTLEMENGDRIPARLRWRHETEVCLQKIHNYTRLSR